MADDVAVWAWLPEAVEPVVVGGLREDADNALHFRYDHGYLSRPDAVALSPTLPLTEAWVDPDVYMALPSALRDSAPDAWGRRVILNALTGSHGPDADTDTLTERTYLLNSGSNRFGAVDFQHSFTDYVPRADRVTLDALHHAADLMDHGEDLPSDLALALVQGTTIGGARPKAVITDTETGVEYLAKFSSFTDPYPVVGAEAACLYLAREAGMDVPEATIVRSLGKDVLILRRFDRDNGHRRMVVSALTLSGLSDMTARYGTYPEFLDSLREHNAPTGTEHALFARIAFNIATSNTDDHLRNHAAFWDGHRLTLTPAYDLSPMMRSGDTAYQAIAYGRNGERESNFASLIETADAYRMSRQEARSAVDQVSDTISDHWDAAADFARITSADRKMLRDRLILPRSASYGLSKRVVSRPHSSAPRIVTVSNMCGAPTKRDGKPCRRRGNCPYH